MSSKCKCLCFGRKKAKEEDHNKENTLPTFRHPIDSEGSYRLRAMRSLSAYPEEPRPLRASCTITTNNFRVYTRYTKGQIRVMEYTPIAKEVFNMYKYNCPICLRYFNTILVTKCCGNYICHFCTEDLSQRRAKEWYNRIEFKCPHCNHPRILLRDVRRSDPLRLYNDGIQSLIKSKEKTGGGSEKKRREIEKCSETEVCPFKQIDNRGEVERGRSEDLVALLEMGGSSQERLAGTGRPSQKGRIILHRRINQGIPMEILDKNIPQVNSPKSLAIRSPSSALLPRELRFETEHSHDPSPHRHLNPGNFNSFLESDLLEENKTENSLVQRLNIFTKLQLGMSRHIDFTRIHNIPRQIPYNRLGNRFAGDGGDSHWGDTSEKKKIGELHHAVNDMSDRFRNSNRTSLRNITNISLRRSVPVDVGHNYLYNN